MTLPYTTSMLFAISEGSASCSSSVMSRLDGSATQAGKPS
jgi:hypothetical protein